MIKVHVQIKANMDILTVNKKKFVDAVTDCLTLAAVHF